MPQVFKPLTFKSRDALACWALQVITVLLYWPCTRAEFVNYDDDQYVTSNIHVQGGFTKASIYWALTAKHAANWHPLTWLSHMLDYNFYALSPAGHHLTNILLHSSNSLLLFILLRRITGAFWPSVTVTALFAWHPLHVESVAWVAERKDVLSTLFWVLTLLAYVSYVRQPGLLRYVLMVGLFCAALMAKAMVVTLPFLLLLLDYWPLQRALENSGAVAQKRSFLRPWRHLLFEKVPLFLLSAATSTVTYRVQKAAGAFGLPHLSVGMHFGNALVSYVRYLCKILWPRGLAVFYPYDESLGAWPIAGAAVIFLVISAWALHVIPKRPYVIVGWLWFVGLLVPVIGLVQVGEQSIADRYTYVPSIGIFIGIVWVVAEFAAVSVRHKYAVIAACPVVFGGCILVTHIQLGYWHDSVALFGHSLAVTQQNEIAEFNLADGLAAKGKMDEAMRHFERELQLKPNDGKAYNDMGLILALQGDLAGATNYYARALMLLPKGGDDGAPHFNLGRALVALGDTNRAITQYTEFVRIRPEHAGGQCSLGTLLGQHGQFAEAKMHLREALKLIPSYADAHVQLARILDQTGDPKEALKHYQQVLSLYPKSIDALSGFAWIRATAPDRELRSGLEAVRSAEYALKLTDVANVPLLETLAAAYAEAGRFSEATQREKEALTLVVSEGREEEAARCEQRVALFESGHPYHEAPKNAVIANPKF